jgi:hypothetical protein
MCIISLEPEEDEASLAISKDFLWETIGRLADEVERLDPQSPVAARVRGFLDARSMGLHTTDRHRAKRAYVDPGEDARVAGLYLGGKTIEQVSIETGHSCDTVRRALKRVGVVAQEAA